MYKRLLSLVNMFIYVERAHLCQKIYCKLLEVTPETMDIQTYTEDGREDTRWVFPLASITGVATEGPDIDRLALKVKWAQSPDEKSTSAAASDAEALS
jgi:hypothetical protein